MCSAPAEIPVIFLPECISTVCLALTQIKMRSGGNGKKEEKRSKREKEGGKKNPARWGDK